MSLVENTDHPEPAELKKVDSAVAGLTISPKEEKEPDKKGHRRSSSTAEGVYNIKELGEYSTTYQLNDLQC